MKRNVGGSSGVEWSGERCENTRARLRFPTGKKKKKIPQGVLTAGSMETKQGDVAT